MVTYASTTRGSRDLRTHSISSVLPSSCHRHQRLNVSHRYAVFRNAINDASRLQTPTPERTAYDTYLHFSALCVSNAVLLRSVNVVIACMHTAGSMTDRTKHRQYSQHMLESFAQRFSTLLNVQLLQTHPMSSFVTDKPPERTRFTRVDINMQFVKRLVAVIPNGSNNSPHYYVRCNSLHLYVITFIHKSVKY